MESDKRHHAVAQEAHRHDLERGLDHALKGGEVAVVVKELAAVVAAIEAVKTNPAGCMAGNAAE
jgi:hypothetical protein